MSNFDPEPEETTLATERDEWAQTQDTRTRIQAVVTGLQEPATAATVADRANCSTNAARKHLGEFVDLGLARQFENDTGTRYVRNDAYFRWRRANDLATSRTIDQLLDGLQDLEAQDEQYRDTFDADSPDTVSLPDGASHSELEDRLEAIGEWQTIRKSIDRHKEALRIARREEDGLTA